MTAKTFICLLAIVVIHGVKYAATAKILHAGEQLTTLSLASGVYVMSDNARCDGRSFMADDVTA